MGMTRNKVGQQPGRRQKKMIFPARSVSRPSSTSTGAVTVGAILRFQRLRCKIDVNLLACHEPCITARLSETVRPSATKPLRECALRVLLCLLQLSRDATAGRRFANRAAVV